MPDIYINARFLTQPITGVQRYGIEMARALDGLIEKGEVKGYNFKLLAPPFKHLHHLELKNIPLRRVGFLSGYLWEQIELPFYARDGLLFCPGNTVPLFSLFFRKKTVVTVHDLSYLYFPEAYSFFFRLAYRIIVPLALKKAGAVITVSHAEKDSILGRYGFARDRLYVVHNGSFLTLKKPRKEGCLDNVDAIPFMLYVGSLSERKNIKGVLEAAGLVHRKCDIKLVVVGACKNIYTNVDLDRSADYVHFRGQIDDDEKLVGLYKTALCLVFPSFYESFGLPALEAMQCACPVVASRAGSLPEICGDAALYCDPHDTNDICEKIMQILTNKTLRDGLRERGVEQAKKFSMEKCARETFAVIKKVLSKQG